MKNLFFFLLVILSPILSIAQICFVNTDFEKTDTIGKSLMQWQIINTNANFYLDSTIKSSGKYSLYFDNGYADSSGQTFSISLPKASFIAMRNIKISLKIRENSVKYPESGLWCKIKKDKKLIGWTSTFKGQLAFPMYITDKMIYENIPLMRWAWTPYNINIDIKDDPDEVIIGGFCISSAWFDEIQITIDGKPINNLIFKMITSNK